MKISIFYVFCFRFSIHQYERYTCSEHCAFETHSVCNMLISLRINHDDANMMKSTCEHTCQHGITILVVYEHVMLTCCSTRYFQHVGFNMLNFTCCFWHARFNMLEITCEHMCFWNIPTCDLMLSHATNVLSHAFTCWIPHVNACAVFVRVGSCSQLDQVVHLLSLYRQ